MKIWQKWSLLFLVSLPHSRCYMKKLMVLLLTGLLSSLTIQLHAQTFTPGLYFSCVEHNISKCSKSRETSFSPSFEFESNNTGSFHMGGVSTPETDFTWRIKGKNIEVVHDDSSTIILTIVSPNMIAWDDAKTLLDDGTYGPTYYINNWKKK